MRLDAAGLEREVPDLASRHAFISGPPRLIADLAPALPRYTYVYAIALNDSGQSVQARTRHEMLELIVEDGRARGIIARDLVSGEIALRARIHPDDADIAERFGSPAHRVNSLSNLASSQHDLGNDEDAIPLLVEALDIIGTQKLKYQQTIVSANLAMCLLATGKPEAIELMEKPSIY